MNKVLVVYATWTGATRTVAEAIAEEFQDPDNQVDVLRAKDAKEVGQYRAVIVCASVHMALLPGEIKRFLRHHRNALAGLSVAYCIVCLAITEETEENRKAVQDYTRKMLAIAPEIEPIVEVAIFGGAVLDTTPEFRRLFALLKVPVRAMAAEKDFRDWQAIHNWTVELKLRLVSE